MRAAEIVEGSPIVGDDTEPLFEVGDDALDRLTEIDGLRVIGPATPISRGGAISFTLDGVHPHDVGQLLDARGIAVRVGHHCAKPVCDRFGVAAVTRASFYLYTTRGEVDALADGVEHVRRFFA